VVSCSFTDNPTPSPTLNHNPLTHTCSAGASCSYTPRGAKRCSIVNASDRTGWAASKLPGWFARNLQLFGGLAWHIDDQTLPTKSEEFGQVQEAIVVKGRDTERLSSTS
jgi:hypothetical protein